MRDYRFFKLERNPVGVAADDKTVYRKDSTC